MTSAIGAGAPRKTSRWHLLYFWLAAFDVLAISASFYLNHRIAAAYSESVHENKRWAGVLADYEELASAAAAVNHPGNDVFASHDVTVERAALHRAQQVFDATLATVRVKLDRDLAGPLATTVRGDVAAVTGSMAAMVRVAETLLDAFAAGDEEAAGRFMARMDQHYSEVAQRLGLIRAELRAAQWSALEREQAATATLQRFELVIVGLILCMIIGIATYGHMMSRNVLATLRDNQRMLAALDAQGASVGLWELDLVTGELSVSPGWSSMLGYPEDAVLSAPMGSSRFLEADDVPRFQALLQAHLDDGVALHIEHRVFDAAQRPRWLSSTGMAQRDARGGWARVIGSSHDVTERRRVAEELERARDAAESSARLKGEFLANISHEIRTPMNGVIGVTRLLLDTGLDPEQRRYADLVDASAVSLLQVLNDVLDFSKVDAGKLEIESRPFRLREWLAEIMRAHGASACTKGLELGCEIAADVPDTVIGDPARLAQILTNLVGNAIKFTDRGRVTVEVTAAANDAALHVCVADTGIGIPANQHALIFEAFRQADGAATRRHGGTGLGLTIAARLTALMGGRIWVTSEPGVGSQFHVEVPIAIATPVETVPPLAEDGSVDCHAAQRDAGGPLRVLLVDDNAVTRRFTIKMLEARAVEVVVAATGHEAVEQFRSSSFELVLLDVDLPDLSGCEVLAGIRSLEAERERRAAIIVMTGHEPDGADRDRWLQAGMDDHIAKPLEASRLLAILDRQVVGGAR